MKEVWEYYQRMLQKYTNYIKDEENARVLKVDCFNEVNNHPQKGGIIGAAPINGEYLLMDID